MGCAVSKPEDQTTVAHCRARRNLIYEAIQHRYSMADAHAAYALSLHNLAASLHAFLLPSVSHVPTVQSNRELPSGKPHVQFATAKSEPSQVRSSDVIINHSKHQPKPKSVTFEERPKSPDPPPLVQNYNFAPYQDPYTAVQSSNFAPYPYPPMDYRMPPVDGLFPFSMSSTHGNNMPSSSRALPPKEPVMPPVKDPPSPDESSWDFLNPFGSYDKYYENYTPNTSFRKVREEEGIPELEEIKDEPEHVIPAPTSKSIEMEKEKEDIDDKLKPVKARGSNVAEKSVKISFEKEAHAKEKEREVETEPVKPTRVFHDDLEVLSEIKQQFERAAYVAKTLADLLEAGKRHYHFKNSINKVAGRLFCGLPSIPNSVNDESNYEEFNAMGNSSSLSITLQKLYIWETKLLEEVQEEENLRAKYQRKCNELNSSDNRGSDPEKIEEIGSTITKISTRIRITIQVLQSISNKISQIRDEELWPQICELVQGLMKMWEIMLECHRAQLHAISQAKTLESIFFSEANVSHSQMEATKELQLDLLSWLTSFSAWIHAQRNYVQSMNNWLKTGLNYEHEITEDGIAPFSPGRLGLPPIFVILNNWSEMIDIISEVNAVEAIKSFYDGVHELHEKQRLEQHQVLTANKDLKAIRTMEREDRLLLKELEAKNRKLKSATSQNNAYLSRTEVGSGSAPDTNSLKSNLRRIFESMEGFASANARAYEELHMHSEEDSSFVN